MSLIKCPECGKEVSDKATACPYCGNPRSQASKTLVQMDSAPNKRRKYRVRFLIFAPMFFFGSIFSMIAFFTGITNGNFGWAGIWFLVALVGLIGLIVSAIGSWLAAP